MKKIMLLSFTDKGRALEKEIEQIIQMHKDWGYEIFEKEPMAAKKLVELNFHKVEAIVFIGATGIAVRYIASYLVSKDVDPAVIVIDEGKKHIISLLSGHLGGANELTVNMGEALGSEPVITTATDVNGKFAVDVWTKKNNCFIEDISKIKLISSKILKDEKVGLYSDFEIKGQLPKEVVRVDGIESASDLDVGIVLSLDSSKRVFKENLRAVPKILVIGAGCRKGKAAADFEAFLLETLEEEKLSLKGAVLLASIDLKKDEECFLKFSEKYGIEFRTYDAEALKALEGDFTKSAFVSSITGVDNVCERSAFLGSDKGQIIMRKKSRDGMTLAFGIKNWEAKI